MSDEAKALTTAEVEGWQANLGQHWAARIGPLWNEVVIEGDRILATTRALETAKAELDSARFARDRYANTIGLIESAVGFSGANPVEETIEHVRRLKVERDDGVARSEKAERDRDEARAEVERRDALISRDRYEDMRQHAVDLAQRLEKAERERDDARTTMRRWESEQDQTMLGVIRQRDEARADNMELRCQLVDLAAKSAKSERERDAALARVAALETALLDACREKVVHGHTTTLLSEAKELRVAGIEQLFLDADQIRDEAKTLVSELVTALTGLERRFLDPKPGDPGGSCWCDPHRYLELQGHEDECEVARAALAKAKGTK